MGLKSEVAFVLYSATKNISKEVKNEMNENSWVILTHNWCKYQCRNKYSVGAFDQLKITNSIMFNGLGYDVSLNGRP